MYEAKDAMTTTVVAISPNATIETAIRILIEKNISGAPVINETGELVGVVSEFQLLEVAYDPLIKAGKIRDFMTKDVLTVHPNTLLTTIANLFVTQRIRRVPVVENGRVVGVIARRDILRYMIDTGRPIDEFFSELRSFVSDPILVP